MVRSWNGGAERLFGFSAGEIIGQPITLIIPEDRLDEEAAIIANLTQGRRIERFDTVRRRKDGSLVDVAVSVSPVRDAAGRVVGASKLARDIAEEKRATERQALLLREMHHRIKNLFAMTAGLVQREGRAIGRDARRRPVSPRACPVQGACAHDARPVRRPYG